MTDQERMKLEEFIDDGKYWGRTDDIYILTIAKLKIERIIDERFKELS